VTALGRIGTASPAEVGLRRIEITSPSRLAPGESKSCLPSRLGSGKSKSRLSPGVGLERIGLRWTSRDCVERVVTADREGWLLSK
jgi:hypothetical protein